MQYDPDAAAACSRAGTGTCGAHTFEREHYVMNDKSLKEKSGGLVLRAATPDDAAALLAIYAPYVD